MRRTPRFDTIRRDPPPATSPSTPQAPPVKLWIPGPTYVRPEILAECTKPMIGHRSAEMTELVEDMSRRSEAFASLWRSDDVAAPGGGAKRLHHAEAGLLELEFSTFAVDGRPELAMAVYNPATEETAARVRALLEGAASRTP